MRSRGHSALLLIVMSAVFALWFVRGPLAAAEATASKQDTGAVRTVWDGVYSEAQVERGMAAYAASCSRCHETGEGPPFVGDAFVRRWFEDGLDAPLRKMREAMPEDAPGSLSEETYVDILGFLLNKMGFPHGSTELPRDPDVLAGILIVEQGGRPGGQVPDFSFVSVVGCLTKGEDGGWRVARSTGAVRAREYGASTPDALKAEASRPLGSQVFRFIQDFPDRSREQIAGHKVQAKGILIRQPAGDQHLNLSTLQSLGEPCGS